MTLLSDQRDGVFDRVAGASVDIGAFEEQTPTPEDFVVTTTADTIDASDGEISLREAIEAANFDPDAKEITFAGDLADATPDVITLNGTRLELTQDVTITGPGANLLTIDGNDASQIFFIGNTVTSSALSGMTLTRGNNPSGNGGAIENLGGDLTITESAITNSRSSGTGGAIQSSMGTTLTVSGSTISGNTAATNGGGGVFGGEVTLVSSTVSDNFAPRGGSGATAFNLTVNNSTIVGNSSDDPFSGGGGLFSFTSTSVSNSIVAGNTAASQSDLRSNGATTGANNLIGDPDPNSGLMHGVDGNIVGQDDGSGGRELLDISSVLLPLADNGGTTLTHQLVGSLANPAIDSGDSTLLPTDVNDVDGDGDIAEPLPARSNRQTRESLILRA